MKKPDNKVRLNTREMTVVVPHGANIRAFETHPTNPDFSRDTPVNAGVYKLSVSPTGELVAKNVNGGPSLVINNNGNRRHLDHVIKRGHGNNTE